MADVVVRGTVGHLETKVYDFVDDQGRRVARDGADLWLLGGRLDSRPTVVKLDDADDIALVGSAGQFAQLELLCDEKRGKFSAVPGQIRITQPVVA